MDCTASLTVDSTPINDIKEDEPLSPVAETQTQTSYATLVRWKSGLPPPSSKRKTSKVWDHFTIIEGCDANNPKAACNYCSKAYNCHSKRHGTSSMIGHLSSCKKFLYGRGPLDKSQTTLSFERKPEGPSDKSQTTLSFERKPDGAMKLSFVRKTS
jgi:hypothetical protein